MTAKAKKNEVKIENNAELSLNKIASAIQSRVDNAENENQAKNIKTELKMFTLPVIEYASANGVDFDKLAKVIAVTDKKNADFLAVYALQKVRKSLVALAQGVSSSFDGYTRTILTNLVYCEQNNKSALVSLSKAIEYEEFDNKKTLKTRYSCSAGTAGTQMSSTRQALRVLGIATVTKGKNQDEFALTDSPLAKRAIEILKAKE